jgi:hypothetical protein
MGHVLNPISMRLSINSLWNIKSYAEDKYECNFLCLQDRNLKSFLCKLFDLKVFINKGYLFSHVNVIYFSKYYDIKVYLYKTMQKLTSSLKYFKNLTKIVTKFFFKTIYKTIFVKLRILFIYFFFKYYKLLNNLSLKKPKQNIYRYDVVLLILLFLRKQERFLCFFDVINFFLIYKKKEKKSVFNLFLLKLFFFFFKFKFWYKITKFIIHFVKNFFNANVILRICKLNYIGFSIYIIGSYLVKRLKQRFRVVELILPIMKLLKKKTDIIGFKFSFCGRFSREEMATAEFFSHAAVSLNTISLFIEYLLTGVILKDSYCGVKIWLNKKKDVFFDLFFFSQNVIWYFKV